MMSPLLQGTDFSIVQQQHKRGCMAHRPLTVIFATHNGAETLRPTLDGYLALNQSHRAWRLIAVNNASTDDTAAILKSYQPRLPLTVIDEHRPGQECRAQHRA